MGLMDRPDSNITQHTPLERAQEGIQFAQPQFLHGGMSVLRIFAAISFNSVAKMSQNFGDEKSQAVALFLR